MSARTRAWLAACIAVLLVAGVVAWRATRDDADRPAGVAGVGHHGPGRVELPEFDVRSVRAGAWSAPRTWSTGRVPAAGEVVHVEHAVSLDTQTARAKQLWLNAPLRFAPGKDTRLTMHGSLVVDRDGLLEMRQADPTRTAVLAFDVADEQAMKGGFQFELGDTGLWVLSGGRTQIHGAPIRETWATLLPGAGGLGATTLEARGDVTDWPAGSEAILTGTNLGRPLEHEVVRVERVTSDGRASTLHLARPLAFDHTGIESVATGEVGLLTHNVRVMSLDPANRAHVFFYGGAGGGISYAQFDRMGPENQFSRYALHFHVMQDSSRGMEVRGSSFRGSGTFWLNIHGSNGMTIVDNVGYQAKGAGFYMEHPAGIDNTWLHNLGVEVAPSEKLQHRNAVFWLLLGNSLIDNVGVGAYGGADSSGFFMPQQPQDDPAVDHPTTILHNEAHSNRQYGFATWMNLSPEFHVVDLLLWRNGDAGFHWGAYATHFKAFRVWSIDNGKADIDAKVKGLYLLDSHLSGAPLGMFFGNGISNVRRDHPSRVIRTELSGHADHDIAIDDVRECRRTTGRCPPFYLQFVDAGLRSASPVRFGWQWNANTRLWFQEPVVPARDDLPASFVLVRTDQPKPSPQAVLDDAIGAWVAPEGPVIEDLPPHVTLSATNDDGGWVVRAAPTDDHPGVRVEFFVNGRPVAALGPTGGVLASKEIPEYSFLVARVTDSSGQVAYSVARELSRSFLSERRPAS
jgi:hypothetical protein